MGTDIPSYVANTSEYVVYLEGKVAYMRGRLLESASALSAALVDSAGAITPEEVARLTQLNRELEMRVHDLDIRISRLKASVSWKITAPIRKVNIGFLDRLIKRYL